ncbi:MAG: hypothetical protein RJA44_226, partial [Pseudomonadota bacterium]
MNVQSLATTAQRAAARQLLELISGNWATQVIGVAARLGLADRIAAGLTEVDALAQDCGCEAESLHRLLRGLASLGLLHFDAAGHCHLSAVGEMLRRDAPASLNAHAQWWSQQSWAVWADLLGSVRSGQSMRQRVRGQQGFEHLDGDAAAAELFHGSMVDLTRLVAADLAEVLALALPQSGVVMDLGGGHGALLTEVLRRRPGLNGLLFDLAHAVAGAQAQLQTAGVAERVTVVEGDFFAALPGPVDVVLLKSVLHDWADDGALRILQRARAALMPTGRVLVIERVMPGRVEDRPADRLTVRSDLNMLVSLGGRERTIEDYDALLQHAGLVRQRSFEAVAAFSVIEAV